MKVQSFQILSTTILSIRMLSYMQVSVTLENNLVLFMLVPLPGQSAFKGLEVCFITVTSTVSIVLTNSTYLKHFLGKTLVKRYIPQTTEYTTSPYSLCH